jgi:16S rRNA (guanine(966)-N(2))-methyltransferase RsmD
MRIIAGSLKGRKLVEFRGSIRPTSDRLRESLFDSLGRSVEDSVWLDLFAGSGAVGLEALSRGARHVVFNDREFDARKLLKRNLEACGVAHGVETWDLDAITFLRKDPARKVCTHIYLDPPYQYPRIDKLLRTVIGSPVFDPENTLVMLETFKKTNVDLSQLPLEAEKTLRGGDSLILMMRC